jgi:hypothetical protein
MTDDYEIVIPPNPLPAEPNALPSIKQLTDATDVLANLVRTAHVGEALLSVQPSPHLNFWIFIYNSLTYPVVLDWCKLFGSDDALHQPTHWKNVVPRFGHEAFRRKLFECSGGENQWRTYRDEMKNYRDKFIAHHDPERFTFVPNHPFLDLAVESSYIYYDYVVTELWKLHGVVHRPANLRIYCKDFSEQNKKVAQRALSATADMPENTR